MTDKDHGERLATLEANSKHQSDQIKTMQTRLWALLVAAAAWGLNFLSKKVGL